MLRNLHRQAWMGQRRVAILDGEGVSKKLGVGFVVWWVILVVGDRGWDYVRVWDEFGLVFSTNQNGGNGGMGIEWYWGQGRRGRSRLGGGLFLKSQPPRQYLNRLATKPSSKPNYTILYIKARMFKHNRARYQ